MSEERFNPADHLMKLKNKDYLPVAARVLWFRRDYPIDSGWGIRTRLLDGSYEKGYAVFLAVIENPQGQIIASGTNVEDKAGFGDFLQKAETGAIGRALAAAGYGTMAALDEGEVVDSPVNSRSIRNQADPPVHDLQCQNCSADVEYSYAQSTRRKSGRVLCVKCAGSLEVHTAQPITNGNQCNVCKKALLAQELQGCIDHPDWFDGGFYCYEHAKSYRLEKKARESLANAGVKIS